MEGINEVTLLGNLGTDPELKYTDAGVPWCTLSLATNESYQPKEGERQERTEWHRVVCWNKTAELVSKHMSKGRQLYVHGRLQSRDYEKDGEKRYITEVVARRVLFLGGGQRQDNVPPPSDGDRGY